MAVARIVVPERADQRDLVHLPGEPRQVLADRDARHVGRDRPELAAELGRGVGLQVPGVDGAQAAVQEDEDQRDVAGRLAPRRRRGPRPARAGPGSVRPRPKRPAVPSRRKSRRPTPSQNGTRFVTADSSRSRCSVVEEELQRIHQAPGQVLGRLAAVGGVARRGDRTATARSSSVGNRLKNVRYISSASAASSGRRRTRRATVPASWRQLRVHLGELSRCSTWPTLGSALRSHSQAVTRTGRPNSLRK